MLNFVGGTKVLDKPVCVCTVVHAGTKLVTPNPFEQVDGGSITLRTSCQTSTCAYTTNPDFGGSKTGLIGMRSGRILLLMSNSGSNACSMNQGHLRTSYWLLYKLPLIVGLWLGKLEILIVHSEELESLSHRGRSMISPTGLV